MTKTQDTTTSEKILRSVLFTTSATNESSANKGETHEVVGTDRPVNSDHSDRGLAPIMKKPDRLCIPITFDVSLERVRDLLSHSLTNMPRGTTSWAQIREYIIPPTPYHSLHHPSDPRLDYPLSPEGAVVVTIVGEVEKNKTCRLDLNSIRDGLSTMARWYSYEFGKFLTDFDDASTGDVFLQCCLFGKVVYQEL